MKLGLYFSYTSIICSSLLTAFCRADDIAAAAGFKTIEEALAIGTLMSDSDALAVGFINFELEVSGNKIGDDDSVNLKNSLDVLVIPYTINLQPKSKDWDHKLMFRAAYINIKRKHQGDIFAGNSDLEGVLDGELQENTFDLFASYSQYYKVSEHWYVDSSLGAHLSYYKNTYQYGADVDDDIKDMFDNNLLNVSTLALIVEPTVGIGYNKPQSWGAWRAHNRSNYIYGHGLGGSIDDPGSVNPEGWRLTNGIEFKIDVPELWGVDDFITVDFKRIDVLGDMENIADKGHYYETNFGWIIDTENYLPLLDNVGVGISVNYGSSISGGTLLLYFNE